MNLNKCNYIEQFRKIKLNNTAITDLHANFFDLLYLNQLPNKSRSYALKSALWLISKVFWVKSVKLSGKQQKAKHLLVPAETDKVRSMGMFSPVMEVLGEGQFRLISLSELFEGISKRLFFKWLFQFPELFYHVKEAFQSAVQLEPRLRAYETQFLVDSLIHTLLVSHLRSKVKGFSSVLVDWDRHRFSSLLVAAANSNGISTYTFVHGAIYTPSKFIPLLAKYCLTWSDMQRNYLCSLGVKPEALMIVGNPRFNHTLPNVDRLKQQYKLIDTKVILYASQNFPDFKTESLIELISLVLEARKGWKLLVRPHPAENPVDIANYRQRFNNVIVLENEISADESLALCDLVILVSSTFSVDSLIKGKNILLYNPWSQFKGIAHNLSEAGAVHFTTSDELSHLLNEIDKDYRHLGEILNKEGTQNFLKNYCTYTGKESAYRVVNALKQNLQSQDDKKI